MKQGREGRQGYQIQLRSSLEGESCQELLPEVTFKLTLLKMGSNLPGKERAVKAKT